MPTYNINNGAIIEAVIASTKDQVTFLNVSHWKVSGLPGPSNGVLEMISFDSLFNIAGGYVDGYCKMLPDSLTMLYVSYQWIFPTRYYYRTFTPVHAAGLVVQPALPSNVCLAVERHADEAGRVNRGEFHIGPVPTTFVTNSNTTAAANAAAADFLNECVTPVSTLVETFTPILFHRAAPADSKVPTVANLLRTSRALHRRTVGVGI